MVEHLRRTGIPGMSIAVVHDTRVVYTAGYGEDGTGRPVTADTPMRIASLSKTFTAMAVMQLVEAGKIDLDRAVTTYLPEFRMADPRAATITPRQLLSHTSGMGDRAFNEWNGDVPSSLRAAVARLRKAKLETDPGTTWSYHNPNYHVAARLVEVVSGMDFQDYLEEKIFIPSGMMNTSSTGLSTGGTPAPPNGHVFVYGQPIALPEPNYFFEGSGDVVSTANDLAIWLVLQNSGGVAPNGSRLISAKGIDQMHKAPAGAINSYSLGWDYSPGGNGRPARIGSEGGIATFTARQVLYPDTGYAFGVLSNGGTNLAGAGHSPDTVVQALLAISEGRTPEQTGSRGWAMNLPLGIATLVVLLCGGLGIARSKAWACRQISRHAWRTVARLAPYALTIGAIAMLPTFLGRLMGRAVDWFMIYSVWFALAALLSALAAVSIALIVSRCAWLFALRRGHPAQQIQTD